MTLEYDASQELAAIRVEAVKRFRHPDGSLDHTRAAIFVRDELERLESAGFRWAAAAREAAELAGHLNTVKATAKHATVTLRIGGRTVTLPGAYARKTDKGQQLVLWLDLPAEDAERLAGDLRDQSSVLDERRAVIQSGVDLARKHGVSTPREGFAAEGVAIEEAA